MIDEVIPEILVASFVFVVVVTQLDSHTIIFLGLDFQILVVFHRSKLFMADISQVHLIPLLGHGTT